MRWRVRAVATLATSGLLLISRHGANAQEPAAALLAAERMTSDLSRDSGLAQALDRSIHPAGVLLWPGAPIVAGQAELLRLHAALQADSLQLTWQPLGVEVAADSSLGVTWGVAVASTRRGSPSLRIGRYIAVWRRDVARWTIAALVFSGLQPLSSTALPSGIPLTRRPSKALGNTGAFVAADLAFARLAADSGAAVAFERWAAPTAIVFGDRGLLIRGPKAIGRTFAAPAQWRWHPVAAGAAATGDLGWTVGEATITPPGAEPTHSKYLTTWVRLDGGTIRFLTDGGNGRPAPRKDG